MQVFQIIDLANLVSRRQIHSRVIQLVSGYECALITIIRWSHVDTISEDIFVKIEKIRVHNNLYNIIFPYTYLMDLNPL